LWERSATSRWSPAAAWERRRQRAIDATLAVTDAVWEAIAGGAASDLRRVVDDGATVEVDGERRAGSAAATLLVLAADWKVHTRYAVAGHSMSELYPASGGRALVRLTVERGRVTAVDITTTSMSLHDRKPAS
jgi:hypothetical protein